LQTAIATVCLSGTLNEKLEAIAGARFKGVAPASSILRLQQTTSSPPSSG